jgi:hypothetical protein
VPGTQLPSMRVLCVRPGLWPEYINRLEQSSDGVTVRWAELPRPTEQLAAQLVPELQQLIADFRPDVLVCGSQGGYYVHRLWERGGCEVPTLMLNCFGDVESFPDSPRATIVHGRRDPSGGGPPAAVEQRLGLLERTAPPGSRVVATDDGHLLQSLLADGVLWGLVEQLANGRASQHRAPPPTRRLGALSTHMRVAAESTAAQPSTAPLQPDSLPVFDARSASGPDRSACMDFFNVHGFAILSDALTADELAHLNEWYERSQRTHPDHWGTSRGRASEWLYHQPLLEFDELDVYVRHPRHYGLVAELLGGEERTRFSEFDFRETPTGQPQNFHQDMGAGGASSSSQLQGKVTAKYICSMHYLTDVSSASPCFAVIPQSHHFIHDEASSLDTIAQLRQHLGDRFQQLPLYAPAGTGIIYDISLFHARMDATTGTETRRAWQTYYSRDDVPALTDWVVVPQRLAESEDETTREFYSLQASTENMRWFKSRDYSTAGLSEEDQTFLRLTYRQQDVR